MTQWPHSYVVVAVPEVIPSALALLDAVMPIEGGGRRVAPFGRPCSPIGSGGPTHFLLAFQATESQKVAFDGAGLGAVPGLVFWRSANPEGTLQASNHAASQVRVGELFDWPDALAALGLALVATALPDGVI